MLMGSCFLQELLGPCLELRKKQTEDPLVLGLGNIFKT